MKTIIQMVGIFGIFQYGLYMYSKHHQRVKVEKALLKKRYILYKNYQGKFQRSPQIFEKLLQECSPFIKVNNQIKIVYEDPEITQDSEQQLYIVGIELNDEQQQQAAKKIVSKQKEYKLAEIPETNYLICTEPAQNIGDTPFNEFIEDIIIQAFKSILNSDKLDAQGQYIEKQSYDSVGNLQQVEISYPVEFRLEKYINHSLIIEKLRKQEEIRKKQEEQRKKEEEAERKRQEQQLKQQQQKSKKWF
ncbi:hypothetical protein TTHERM_01109850 (macronuclear) [Tetrahymena thermophila SB210]|uniref:Uncharacterized protein n=1 Tax=Tetrahymena thermophila (strain SB210) TaxID=312017 RepID=Q22B70_TETTS|nr:hypothetical protein TTHERM_01109850 [Tetrahymena thermophila SB210]EAR82531.3 hypothetical protein TTHERM_01109850 [Tetrahymena thermophila SB210]|eukprot:XP_001030194.3 hypothetical protein TTHERM_01109850 [Tetrahymena thermophila SB210]